MRKELWTWTSLFYSKKPRLWNLRKLLAASCGVSPVATVFMTGFLTYRESNLSIGNSAMVGAVFSNHFTVSAFCFIFSTSPA